MDEPTGSDRNPTVGDVLQALQEMEDWLRRVRHSLDSLPHDQELTAPAFPSRAPQLVRGKVC